MFNRLIPSIAVTGDGKSSHYRKSHSNIRYIGDPLNAIRILSEFNPDEIAVINTLEYIPSYIYKFPSHALRPISIVGSINSIMTGRELIHSGYDRIGITLKSSGDIKILRKFCDEFGGSSIVVHLKVSPMLWNMLEFLSKLNKISEIVIHDVTRSGSLAGIDNQLVEELNVKFGDVLNLAISGGFNGIPVKMTVYYSTYSIFANNSTPFNISSNSSILISHSV